MRNYGTTDTYQQTTRRQRGGRQRTAGVAAVPVADGRAWPDNESTYHHTKHLRRRRSGGHRRVWRAWLRCPWAEAGPRQKSHAIQKHK